MKLLRTLSLFVFLFGLLVCTAHSRELISTETVCTLANVTVATTDETVIATLTTRIPQGQTYMVRVSFWGTMTTSADSSAYTLKARRDSISGTVLGDSIAELIKVAAGGVEAFYFEFAEERSGDFSALTYVSTIDMTGASANTTVSQNCLTIDVIQ